MKKPPTDKKEDKKPTSKEEKPKYEEIIFSGLCDPKMTFDHTGYTFTSLILDVFYFEMF